MTVTATHTVREIVTDALLDIESGTLGQAPQAAAMALGVRHLNRLMKRLQQVGFFQHLTTRASITATTSAATTLIPARPFRINGARYRSADGIDIPMIEMTADEYDELPIKTTTGIPTQFYFDKQAETSIFYVWPVLASVTTETYEITYEREFEDITDEDDVIDIPAEGYDAMVLALADRLAPTFGKGQRKMDVKMEAKNAINEFLGGAGEGTVHFF